ncbi:hypothetical protein [Bdellovibrio sp. HCB209]|uniref:hypothetical protein n=1 Tax=Bdellovibrio sp. HCB209 TaxID=3394354 RepID=UPI0039B66A7D
MKVKSFIFSLKLALAALIGVTVYSLDTRAVAKTFVPVINTVQLGQKSPTCNVVTVHAVTEINGKSFYQSGIGWVVISKNNEREVITPAHVIHGATKIIVQCSTLNVFATIKGVSVTKDIAVLKIQTTTATTWAEENFLTALIYMQEYQDFKAKYPGVGSDAPDHTALMDNKWFDKSGFKRWTYVIANQGREMNTSFGKTNDQMIQSTPKVSLLSNKSSASYGGSDLVAVETFAIRPGFSGTPLIFQDEASAPGKDQFSFMKNGKYVAGMLIRTDISGGRSLAITIGDVIRTYFEISDVTDATIVFNAPLRIERADAVTGPIIRYTLKAGEQALSKTPVLLQSMGGARYYQATEVCKDSYQESSDWISTKGINFDKGDANFSEAESIVDKIRAEKENQTNEILRKNLLKEDLKNKFSDKNLKDNLLKGGTNSTLLKVGGGDYTEGGGGIMAAINSTFKTDAMQSENIQNMSTSMYRTETTCKTAGILSPNKPDAILVGYVDSKGVGHKVSDLNDLTSELINKPAQERLNKISEIYAGAVYATKGSFDLRPLCQSPLFHKSKKRSFEGVSSLTFKYDQGTETAQKNYGVLSSNDNANNYIACNSSDSFEFSIDQRQLKYAYGIKGANSFPMTTLKMAVSKNSAIVGQAQIGDSCKIELNQNNLIAANIWKYQIRDPKIHADISLDTKDRIIRFKIFSVAPECQVLNAQGQTPWYAETNISEDMK